MLNRTLLIYDDKLYRRLDDRRGGFYYYPDTGNMELFDLLNYQVYPFELMPSININARSTKISPDRSKLALAHLYNPVIEVYDINNKTLKTFNYSKDNNIKKRFSVNKYNSDNLIEYYDFIDVTNDHIYVLYRGEKYTTKSRSCLIKKYNWQGNLVSIFKINEKYDISKFFIDSSSNVLIAQSYNNDSVYRFKLH
ncbi:MAG: hypothetical protein FH748_06355 [Balneolaceae bacterium]|nr:hypothetical protein [Balneolaceae bacterium]